MEYEVDGFVYKLPVVYSRAQHNRRQHLAAFR